ncbi:hypothetical protein L4C54_02325 [Vibrio lamellibrachiae]|uniref:hypothetical protein n=1 Tax=Vibrio lamellibrachiae TaxID=2910253 RepID=UPI003D096DE4
MQMMMNQISTVTPIWRAPKISAKWKKRAVILFFLINIIVAVAVPRAYFSLWLTNDQYAAVMFTQSRFNEAADSFENPQWRALSLYAAQDFKQAAQTWRGIEGESALFHQANALAHSNYYHGAFQLYQQILRRNQTHVGAKTNIAIVEPLIRTAASSGDSKGSTMIEKENKSQQDELLGNQYQDGEITDKEWLEEVVSDPSVFLKKKFFIEQYEEAKRKAQAKEKSKVKT